LPPNFIETHFAVYAKAPRPCLGSAATKDSQLKDLQIAVYVGETDVAEPSALLVDGSQDVGILARKRACATARAVQ
jgi:hypothetical protein